MLSINTYLEKNIIFYLFEKFNNLSNKNTFTNPFYYYFWNIPATFQPWSIFAIIGTIYNFSEGKDNKYLLTIFPLTLIGVLSIFSTKTPYYALQISSIFVLNTFVGIRYLFNSKKYKQIFIFVTSKIVPLFLVVITLTHYIFLKNVSDHRVDPVKAALAQRIEVPERFNHLINQLKNNTRKVDVHNFFGHPNIFRRPTIFGTCKQKIGLRKQSLDVHKQVLDVLKTFWTSKTFF